MAARVRPKRLALSPVLGNFTLLRDGSTSLSASTDGSQSAASSTTYVVQLGPYNKYAAVAAALNNTTRNEVSISEGLKTSGYIRSELSVDPTNKTAETVLTTRFASKVVRIDRIAVAEGRQVVRTVQWKYPNGVQVDASYTVNSRTLVITKNDQSVVSVLTKGSIANGTLTAQTTRADGSDDLGGVYVYGGKVISIGRTDTSIEPANPDGSGMHTKTVTVPDDGGPTVATETIDDGAGTVTSVTVTTTTDGIQSDGIQIQTVNGQTVVTSAGSESTPEGQVRTVGQASTDAEGGFSSTTIVEVADASSGTIRVTQRSSFSADSDGNSSETTITYNEDGSFQTTITSTDSTGSTMTDTQSYDKDGNPVPSDETGGGGSGSGTGDSEGSGASGTDGSGPSGGGEYPTDDGSDPVPLPSFSGKGDDSFTDFTNSLGPYLGGNPGPEPSSNPVDPPFDDIASAMDSEANPVSTAGASGSGGSDDSGHGGTIDLRPFSSLPDPDLNPQALVGILGALTGLQNSAGISAAKVAASTLSGISVHT